MSAAEGRRYCGREFSGADLAHIRALLEIRPALGRVALSRRVCQDLGWLNALGQPKEMSARVALLRMEKDGVIQLPAPRSQNGRGQRRFPLTAASDPRAPVPGPVRALEPLRFQRVSDGRPSRLWNELIARYHYLGYRPLSGAQMRGAAMADCWPPWALAPRPGRSRHGTAILAGPTGNAAPPCIESSITPAS